MCFVLSRAWDKDTETPWWARSITKVIFYILFTKHIRFNENIHDNIDIAIDLNVKATSSNILTRAFYPEHIYHILWRNICYLPAGRSVWWKTVTEVLKMLPEAEAIRTDP